LPTIIERLEHERSTLARQIRTWTRVAIILVVSGLAAGAWYIYWYLWPAYRALSPPDSEEMARFGSYLQGAAGTVWTLATVLFIYVAFLGQRMQILFQQQELEMTNADVAEQRQRLDEQAAMSRKQLFESSFFQLLGAHARMIDSMSILQGVYKQAGRDCFTHWYGQLRQTFFPPAREQYPQEDKKAIEAAFNQLYSYWRTDLGHYFRSLYNLIKFVKAAQVSDPRFYTNLVRAQISDQEVLILFYNCLTPRGAKFHPLVEEFALLKHLDPKDLCAPDHAGLYRPRAYGNGR
jgi:hypothetical protein